MAGFKKLLIETLQDESTAMLLDPHYAYPFAIESLSPAKGLVVTLEDSLFAETPGGRLSSEIDNWSVEKIKRIGSDAVKVLAWHRPDADASVCSAQKDFVKRIGDACARFDIPFLLELLVYPLRTDSEQTTDYVEMKTKRSDHVLQSVEEFARDEYLVDILKLESPVAAGDLDDAALDVQGLFDEMGRLARCPWVMLSAGAGKADFEKILVHAYAAGASGYLAGRAIWLDAFDAFPDWTAIKAGLRGEATDYMRRINDLTDRKAHPWQTHPRFRGKDLISPRDGNFRAGYFGFNANREPRT